MKQTPIEIVLDDDPEPARIHTCTVCGTRDQWGPEWTWYGSIRDLDDGKPIVTCCSVLCRKQHASDTGIDSGLVK